MGIQNYSIAVAGCGPCGLAASLLLHRQGHHVTVYERFEAPRPIGSGLMIQPTGLAVLRALGLDDAVVQSGARIDRLFGMAKRRAILDVHYRALRKGNLFGIGVHRATLFSILYDAVRNAGVPIHTGHVVTGTKMSGSKRRLTFVDRPESPDFDLVVDTLGTRTPLSQPIGKELSYGALWATLSWPQDAGFDFHTLEQRYHRASKMVGVLPLGSGLTDHDAGGGTQMAAFFWSIRADAVEAWRTSGLKAWKAEVIDLWPACAPLLDQILDAEQLTFARYAHRTMANPQEEALVHIGDAWHSASPQLGQGANMALLDAYALALGLAEGRGLADGITRAIQMRKSHVRTYQALTALFTPVYQSDSRLIPFVRDRVVGPLSKIWPATSIQAAMVAGLIGNPLHPLGLNES